MTSDLRTLMGKMGTGPKSSEDMTYDEANKALETVFSGETADTTLGAFWMANRWKSNTVDELTGFVDAMRIDVEVAEPTVSPVDCGANYDGKAETALLGVAAGVVSAAAGTPVVVHSSDEVPTLKACTYRDVLRELDVDTDLDPRESAEMTDRTGFGFYYQPRFNPEVHELLPRRREMGVRTFVNTVETLANPANADVHLGSFYHLTFASRVIDVLAASDMEVERVLMFQGLEGYDDIRPGSTKVAEWDGERMVDYEIETSGHGMDFDREALKVDSVREDSAKITEEVLRNERDDAFADAVLLNAALRMYAGGSVDTVEEGVEEARSVVEDGSAYETLEEIRDV